MSSDQPQQWHQPVPQPGGPVETGHDDAPPTAARHLKPSRSLFAEAVTIARPAAELYAFWRDPVNLLGVMENIQSIAPLDRDRSTWTVRGPGGSHYSWVSAITHDVPEREIGWRSEPGGEIDNAGKVEFVPAGARGTIVRVTTAYDPPGGVIGRTLAKLLQREPRIQTRRDLHRFKQLMETGEIATAARNRREHRETRGDTA